MVPVDDWRPHPLLSQLSIVDHEPKCACGGPASEVVCIDDVEEKPSIQDLALSSSTVLG